MESVVCTLFEGSFHKGVAVLANSLYNNGFRGAMYVGYKGALPVWCSASVTKPFPQWPNATTLEVTSDFQIHFLPLTTHFHFTNYKPNFMLELWDGPAKTADSIAYFDPDIVVKCPWSFFETWMKYGAALVHEVVSNDMPPTHPLRMQWNNIIEQSGRKITREVHSYINAGFCGVARQHVEFLHTWKEVFQTGIDTSQLKAENFHLSKDRTSMFYTQDQDVLNIAAMCSKAAISEMGPEAMDFIHGGYTMAHATGSSKPWTRKYLSAFLMGFPPSSADKLYWVQSSGPIQCFSQNEVKRKKLAIKTVSFLGRFYRRY